MEEITQRDMDSTTEIYMYMKYETSSAAKQFTFTSKLKLGQSTMQILYKLRVIDDRKIIILKEKAY